MGCERRLERIADELEIRNIVARLAILADTAPADNLSEYLSYWTEDAIWETSETLPDEGQPGSHIGRRLVGRAEIEADRKSIRTSSNQGPGSGTRHLNVNLAVDVQDDGTAAAESYFVYLRRTTAGIQVGSFGHYHDSFRRTEWGWKLARRRFDIEIGSLPGTTG